MNIELSDSRDQLSTFLIAKSEESKFSRYLDPVDNDFPLQIDECLMSEVSLQTIHNANLVSTPRGIGVFDRFGHPVDDAQIGDREALSEAYQNVPKVEIDGSVVVMTSFTPHCYYHWLIDTLPAFEVLESSGVDLDSIDNIFMKRCSSSFQLKALAAVGINQDQVICSNCDIKGRGSKHHLNAKIDRMLIPRFRELNGEWVNRWVVQKLQNRFGHVLKAKSFNSVSETRNRLYIERGKGAREIINELDLINFLKGKGFKTIDFSEKSIEEQCEAVQSADLILGAHGSGLGNAIFAAAGTYFIEFYGEYAACHFRALSNIANLRYGSFKANVTHEKPNEALTVHQQRAMPFMVSIEKVSDYLAANGI